ncbi:fimbria/pilus outer membrane usher protein [Burkholderia sp. 22PA0106]|uniref:fimbria/pilus outer membrane usher protein n=1 Tax=Burkholderia sp. 22PA0106 TaxID=3237371 RepID=UPI0039C3BB1B
MSPLRPRACATPVFVTRPTAFAIAIATMLAISCDAARADGQPPVEFNSSFLRAADSRKVDLARFAFGNPIAPGRYDAAVTVNGKEIGMHTIDIARRGENTRARPAICTSRAQLATFGVDTAQLDAAALRQLDAPSACLELEDLVDGAQAHFDPDTLTLAVTIPQALTVRTPHGYVDTSQWQDGVTAGYVGYTFSAYRNQTHGHADLSTFTSLSAGLNIGEWHVRHDGSLSTQPKSAARYQNALTYVERDLTTLRGRLTLGQSNTSGELFDTYRYTGVQVESDDRMLPTSQQGYAPTVRGVAKSNARVKIRQGGTLIYDRAVPPGPFVIDDLLPNGYGRALDVSVTEADGRVRRFSVAYESVPMLIRPGNTRYSVTAGRLDSRLLDAKPAFFQATVQRGVTNALTAYGGVQATARYLSVLGGVALGTPAGALSLDVTAARTRIGGNTQIGTSTRVSFSKTIESTGSSMSLATYRFSSRGYLSLVDAHQAIDSTGERGDSVYTRPKMRTSVLLNQALGPRWGSVFVSASSQNYWNRSATDLQFQAGYSNRYRNLSYSVTANRVRAVGGTADNQFMLSLSMPLGRQPRAPQLSLNLDRGVDGGIGAQAMLSGVAGKRGQLAYNVSGNRDAGGQSAGSLNAQYRGSLASVSAGYGQGSGYQNVWLGLSGTAVIHSGGVALSADTGDTIAIISAPGAAGATINGSSASRLDRRGYGIVTGLSPYRVNDVTLDPRNIPDDVELSLTSQRVVPRAGAIVELRYPTVTGQPALFEATLPDGSPVPFGASATDADADGHTVGIVGQHGQLYARLPQRSAGAADTLTLSWGNGRHASCVMTVRAPDADDSKRMGAARATCEPLHDAAALFIPAH